MKKGFTLFELLCVLALISVLIMFAGPSVQGYIRKDRLRLATESLINDLRYAKMHAITTNTPEVKVYFEKLDGKPDYNGYWIYTGDVFSRMTLKRVKLPEGVVIFEGTGGSTFNTDKIITFTDQGNITPFACTIALKDLSTGGKKYITLTIGFTRIKEVKR